MDQDWVRALREQCTGAGVAFFYKQDSDPRGRKIPTPELDGQRWTQMPTEAGR
jgi:protein gp37